MLARRPLVVALLVLWLAFPAVAQHAEAPRLVVVLVVDQLPRQYLDRFRAHFSPGGFRRLLEKGADYPLCHHQHQTTLTGPGHASLLTGAYPVHSGIIANKWYSRREDRRVDCVEDERYPILHESTTAVPDGAPGISPRKLLASTVGDVLRMESGSRAKVVSIAIKERSAVLLGGWRPNGVYWYEPGTCRFTTSTYYAEALPEWVARFNAGEPCAPYIGKTWTKLLPDLDYTKIAAADDLPYERPSYGLTTTFPHRIEELKDPETGGSSPYRYAMVIASPFGNELVLQLAQAAVKGEGLGKDEVPDLLAIGFSSNDYIGHLYGPQSQEVADLTLRTDRQVAELMRYLDAEVGSGKWTLALTSDHGIAPIPEHLEEIGVLSDRDDHYRINVETMRPRIEAALAQRFFPDGKTPADFPGFFEAWDDATSPFIYLNRGVVAKLPDSPDFEELQEIVAAEIEKVDGVSDVYTRQERRTLGSSSDVFAQRAYRAWHDGRGGDLLVRLEPYWLPLSQRFATTHGAPYSYDAQVPMLLFGAGVRPGQYLRPVAAIDLASTVARLLRVSPPPADQGAPLFEALK